MGLVELYNPERGTMDIAGFMSGSGTNLVKIIEHAQRLEAEEGKSPYRVSVIFTDKPESRAGEIGKEYGIPVITRNLRDFCKRREVSWKDMDARIDFDMETVDRLEQHSVDVIAFAGYMLKATGPLLVYRLGVNVHPADLSVLDVSGQRKYTGAHAVRDALLSGAKELRSTTHIVEPKVDEGRILMVSAPLHVRQKAWDFKGGDNVDAAAESYQEALKQFGDWVIFPRTLEYIACGRFSKDEDTGELHFDDEPIPNGIRLEAD